MPPISEAPPPELAESLRILSRLPARERLGVEAAIRAQYAEDLEATQARAALEAEEANLRRQEEEAEALAEVERHAAALREEEAHISAAKQLVDLAKASDGVAEPRKKTEKVVQDDAQGNNLDILVATPSQKVRDKIRNNDYVDLWHLTAEGMAAATKSKLAGDTTFELETDGSFKLKDSVAGFNNDQDLSPAAWTVAIGHYVRIMIAEGVESNIVEAMIRLNRVLLSDPFFHQHGAAIRLWPQLQRRQWVLSGALSTDGRRFNLGKPNPKHFEEIRLRLLEERAERRVLMPSLKRSASDEPTPAGPRNKISKGNFRCFVCASTESGHPFRTCAAYERIDGKQQHVVRSSAGRVVFADTLKPVCIDYQLRGCHETCRAGGNHRCANCGAGGHGLSSCAL